MRGDKMDLILTHEYADFDALASLVAAQRLYPAARAVRPRTLNQNVRAFLTVYGGEFSLCHPEDLQRRRARDVLLVDTQHLVSVKGVNAKSILHVIDHHPLDEHARIEGTRVIEPLGATTTLLLEELRERGMTVSANEATFFLLGIYEDTGNLTYAATTPRDLQAAAWLLAQGANLRIVAEFLRQPLNSDQRALYDKLLAGAETHRLNGQTVVLATGTLVRSGEELSALAHKLRDALEPAALFLLVQINGDVQLVARSSTTAIDVGVIAREFGGGGHGRAAAALLAGSRLAEVRARLLQELPTHVQPTAVVADIMSHGVHTLNPETTVEQVYAHMQKHGYEGYPVVEAGQVLGLVTRRAVDRARTHQLEHTSVTDIMEAGAVTVSPDDSVDRLLNEMIGHGWGQIPVSRDGDIVGVVTRTDLIKELALSPQHGRRNVTDLLQRALSPSHLKLLYTLSAAAQSQGSGLYVVGGFVRDLLLESASVDYDLVVEGDAIELGRVLAKQHGGRVTAHRRFGTAKWLLPDELAAETGLPALDLVSARTEFYTRPSALPEVERGSIKLDLHRRDFTVNTLAVSLQSHRFGDLLDHWGGLKDLEEKRLRVLHSLSFVDDPTRVLRAVRLEKRLGFQIDRRSAELMELALPLLARVSGDRIRHEIEHMFAEAIPQVMLARLDEIGVPGALHAALAGQADAWLAERFVAAREAAPEEELAIIYFALWLYRLEWSDTEAICRRLKVTAATMRVLQQIPHVKTRLPALGESSKPSGVVGVLDGCVPATLSVVALAEADAGVRENIRRYRDEFRRVKPTICGADLRALGVRPGPEFGRVLGRLRAAWLDGEVSSSEEEVDLLRELLKVETEQPT